MAGKYPNRRLLETHPFREGATITVDVSGSKRILHSIVVLINGKMTLTTAPTRVEPGATMNWLERFEFIYSGYDSGVDARRAAETRISLKGRYFGHGLSPVGAVAQDNGLPRLNVLLPDSPMIANSDMIKLGNFASNAEQDIKLAYECPFYLEGGLQPRDYHLDMSNARTAQVRIKLGKLTDCGSGAQAFVGKFEDAQVEIYVEEMEVDDAIKFNGGIELPKGYMSIFDQTINIDADNAGLRKDIQIPANLMSLYIFGYDENGVPSDSFLKSVRLESEGDGFYEASADYIRYSAYNNYKRLAAPNVGTTGYFKGSGFYPIDMARDQNGVHLLQSRHMGQGNNQSAIIYDVKKSTGGIGRMEVLTVQAHLDVDFRAATKKYKNMTGAERAIADANEVDLNARAQVVEQRAANANIS